LPRILLSILYGSLVVGLVLGAASTVVTYEDSHYLGFMKGNFLLFTPIFSVAGYVTGLIIFTPIFVILNKLNILNTYTVILIGILVSLVYSYYLFGSGHGMGASLTWDRVFVLLAAWVSGSYLGWYRYNRSNKASRSTPKSGAAEL